MKKSKKEMWLKIFTSGLGPVLSLISFVVVSYFDLFKFGERQELATIPALLLSIIILYIGHIVDSSIENRRNNDKYENIQDSIKTYLHVIKIGTTEVSFNYILNNLNNATCVKNTSFTIPSEADVADEELYSTATYKSATKKISEFACNGKLWKDVGDKRAIERFRKIHMSYASDENQEDPKYQYRLLINNIPQINFTILEYEDRESEVLFNWDYKAIGQKPLVLLSRDKTIINMFNMHFEHLWRVSSKDHDIDKKDTKSTPRK